MFLTFSQKRRFYYLFESLIFNVRSMLAFFVGFWLSQVVFISDLATAFDALDKAGFSQCLK